MKTNETEQHERRQDFLSRMERKLEIKTSLR